MEINLIIWKIIWDGGYECIEKGYNFFLMREFIKFFEVKGFFRILF